MASKSNPPKAVETLKHAEATRKNISTAEFQSVMQKNEQSPVRVAYERRNRDLEPQLVAENSVLSRFRTELFNILDACNPKPETRFCMAIEEGEAWFLGDITAVKAAYPKAKDTILRTYKNDSICGTWERLADAVFPGGSQALLTKGWQAIGAEKSAWSEGITPHMNVEMNGSPSFCYFIGELRELVGLKVD